MQNNETFTEAGVSALSSNEITSLSQLFDCGEIPESDSHVKWLACYGLSIDVQSLAALERLERFGYLAVQGATGQKKIQIACLVILDTLMSIKNPNILICCPEPYMWEWYCGIVTRLGLEFKIISDNNIKFFSNSCANLLIVCDKSRPLKEPGKWDLIIIDSYDDCFGDETYTKLILGKTEKLAVFAEHIKRHDEEGSHVFALAEGLLSLRNIQGWSVREAYDTSGFLDIESITNLQPLSPVMLLDFGCEDLDLKLLEYRTAQGGYDEKLACLINELKNIICDFSNTVIIYFREKATLDMVHEALISAFPQLTGLIRRVSTSTADNSGLHAFLNNEKQTVAHVIMARDIIASGFPFLPAVTHIFNYEYPNSIHELLRRYKRRGKAVNFQPVFYLFSDTGMCADGKILQNQIFSQFYMSYQKEIPMFSVLAYIDKAGDYILRLLINLKSLLQEDSASVSRKLEKDYSIACDESNAKETVRKILFETARLFGVGEMLFSYDTDQDEILARINLLLYGMQQRPAYYNKEMRLCLLPDKDLDDECAENPPDYDNHRYICGLAAAIEEADIIISNKAPLQLSDLSDCMRIAVRYNLWRYKCEKLPVSYPQFLKSMDGVMI